MACATSDSHPMMQFMMVFLLSIYFQDEEETMR